MGMTTSTLSTGSRTAELFHALADITRIEVVTLLQAGEKCVCDLMCELDLQQSRLSWHLKTLSDAGIITGRRDGRWIYYSLNAQPFLEARELLDAMRPRRRVGVRSPCCD